MRTNTGGAIFIWNARDFNSAPAGASVAADLTQDCNVTVTTSAFTSNVCQGGYGGAVMMAGCASQLLGCSFAGNRARLGGGAVASVQYGFREEAELPDPRIFSVLASAAGFGSSSSSGAGGSSTSTGASERRRQAMDATAGGGFNTDARHIVLPYDDGVGNDIGMGSQMFVADAGAFSTAIQQASMAAAKQAAALRFTRRRQQQQQSQQQPTANGTAAAAAGGDAAAPAAAAGSAAAAVAAALAPYGVPRCQPRLWFTWVAGCNFTENAADLEYGGGLYADAGGSGLIVVNASRFETNVAASQHGGGAFLVASEGCSAVNVTGSIFERNKASDAAGGGGAAYLLLGPEDGCTANVSGSTFVGNSAAYGK